MDNNEIKVAKELVTKLVASLQRPQWLQVAAGLKAGKALARTIGNGFLNFELA